MHQAGKYATGMGVMVMGGWGAVGAPVAGGGGRGRPGRLVIGRLVVARLAVGGARARAPPALPVVVSVARPAAAAVALPVAGSGSGSGAPGRRGKAGQLTPAVWRRLIGEGTGGRQDGRLRAGGWRTALQAAPTGARLECAGLLPAGQPPPAGPHRRGQGKREQDHERDEPPS